MPGIALEIRRKCKICGKVFLVKKLDSQYCSGKCSKIAYKRKCDAEKKEERLAKMASQVPNIREYSIPSRQIGNYVYVPKEEIDNLYKSDIL